MKTCVLAGCERLLIARGMCGMHYQRWKTGYPLDAPTKEMHGQSKSPTYRSWCAMMHRCYAPNASDYKHYGGRGIAVCQRWRSSFGAFLEDMGERPPSMTIDRIDGNGDYEPRNCKWSDQVEQATRSHRDRGAVPFRGVNRATRTANYESSIRAHNTCFYIGSYKTPEEAAWMYDQWALCLHRDYAQLNFEYVKAPI